MTLVGKIFTVLIFIMSLVFMSFAVMVFATHKNWKEAALSKEASKATGQIGLKPRLEEAYAAKRALELELESLKTQLAEHQAARRMALAVLQSKVEQASTDLVAMQSSLDKLQTAHTQAVAELAVANATLDKVTADNSQLRTDIVGIQQDRDQKLARVVSLVDTSNQAQTKLTQLEERQQQLIAQVAYQKMTLEQNGINPDEVPVSLEKPIDGVVTAVSERNLVEISIGMDDGLRVGVPLEAYRDNRYLGRIIVRKVTANRSVAEIDTKLLQAPIRKGDRVATKL